jgi:hypothetical protein
MVKNELNRFRMGFKAQLFGQKPYVQGWFIPALVSIVWVRGAQTYALHILVKAARRSRTTNMSIR